MSKPKKWDLLSPVEQEAWRERKREYSRKYREDNPEKCREIARKWRELNLKKARETYCEWRKANLEKDKERCRESYHKTRQQSAADQFFIMAGAAEQLTKLKPKQ